jgi:hypothetical protein
MSQINPVHVLSTHLHLGLPSCHFPSGFLAKTLYAPLLSTYLLSRLNETQERVPTLFNVLSCRLPGENKENLEELLDIQLFVQNLNSRLPEYETGFILNKYRLQSDTYLPSLLTHHIFFGLLPEYMA